MRGTRVDKLENGRYRILHFGIFSPPQPSVEMDMSEKDAHNLYNQLGIALFPSDKEDSE